MTDKNEALPTPFRTAPTISNTHKIHVSLGHDVIASCFYKQKAGEDLEQGSLNEDAIIWQANSTGEILSFAVCDGASQAYLSYIASNFLAERLVAGLNAWIEDPYTAQALTEERLRSYLDSWVQEGQQLVARHHIDLDRINPLLKEVMLNKQRNGSQAVFFCGCLDFRLNGRSIFVWLGNVLGQVFDQKNRGLLNTKTMQNDLERWTTVRGCTTTPHIKWIDTCDIRQIFVASDGIDPGIVQNGISPEYAENLVKTFQNRSFTDDASLLYFSFPATTSEPAPRPYAAPFPPTPAHRDLTPEPAAGPQPRVPELPPPSAPQPHVPQVLPGPTTWPGSPEFPPAPTSRPLVPQQPAAAQPGTPDRPPVSTWQPRVPQIPPAPTAPAARPGSLEFPPAPTFPIAAEQPAATRPGIPDRPPAPTGQPHAPQLPPASAARPGSSELSPTPAPPFASEQPTLARFGRPGLPPVPSYQPPNPEPVLTPKSSGPKRTPDHWFGISKLWSAPNPRPTDSKRKRTLRPNSPKSMPVRWPELLRSRISRIALVTFSIIVVIGLGIVLVPRNLIPFQPVDTPPTLSAAPTLSVVPTAIATISVVPMAIATIGPTRDEACKPFPQTNLQICGKFLEYWNAHGGLDQFGYPISARFLEESTSDGKSYVVQYFERAVLQLHPENAGSPYEVLLTPLGTYWGKQHYPQGLPGALGR